jgi:fatty acid amide hydrolase
LTLKGTFDTQLFPGLQTMIDQPGVLARHVPDLTLALSVLGAPGLETIDPSVQPMPWGDPARVSVRDLRIAYYLDDGVFSPSPVKRRAVQEAATALRDRGAVVEEWTPPNVAHGREIYIGLISAAGSGWARLIASKEKLDRRAGHPLRLMQLPHRALPLLAAQLRRVGQHRTADYISWGGRRSAASYSNLMVERDRYRDHFLSELNAKRYDAILCPSAPFPALLHGTSYFLSSQESYTQVYNLLGMPAGHVTTTRVRVEEESDRPFNWDIVDRTARKVEAGSAGLPAGVQVVARHWREDLALAVMSALEEHFRGQPDYPHRPPI